MMKEVDLDEVVNKALSEFDRRSDSNSAIVFKDKLKFLKGKIQKWHEDLRKLEVL